MKYAIENLTQILPTIGRWVACCCIVLPLASVSADVLVTAGGESLSGTISRVADGILVFRTSLRGQMMLPMSEVRSLESRERWIVTRRDESVEIGRLVSGGIVVDGSAADGGETVLPLDYQRIRSIKNAPPLSVEDGQSAESARWEQRVSTSLEAYAGTSDGFRSRLAWEAMREGLKTRLGLRLQVTDLEGERAGDTLSGAAHLLPRVPDGWSPYMDLRVERQVEEALRWRTGIGVGVRYDFDGDPERGYFAYVGASIQRSVWRERHGSRLGRRATETHTTAGPEVGVGYERPLWTDGRWDSRLSVRPGSGDGSAVWAAAESTLTYPLSPKLHLRFDVSVAFEEDPVFDTLERFNTRFGAGLEFNF